MYPTKFDKRVHERYLEGVEDGKRADVRLDNMIDAINETLDSAGSRLGWAQKILGESCRKIPEALEKELGDKIVGKTEEMLTDLYQRELQSHEQAAKEGTYNGAEQALKHAVDQILQVMSPEALLKLAQEKKAEDDR